MLDKSTKLIVRTALRAAGVEPDRIAAAFAILESKQPDANEPKAALLAQAQKARQLGVSRFTIWRLTAFGRLRPVELLPGFWRYRSSEMVEDLERRWGSAANL